MNYWRVNRDAAKNSFVIIKTKIAANFKYHVAQAFRKKLEDYADDIRDRRIRDD